MKLILLRHGIAADRDETLYPRDSQRPLTPEGRRRMQQIARVLTKLDVRPDAILTSPYIRAHQTAVIVAEGLGLKKRLRICEHLASEGDPKRLFAEINKLHGDAHCLILVGHEPDLSELASLLVSGRPDGAGVELKKGGLCLLEAEQLRAGRCAMLKWLAPPKLLVR